MNKDAKLWIGIVAGLVFVLVLTIGYMVYQHSKMQNLVEEFDIQKEELEDEYAQLAIQYEGFKLDINNDSIQMQYENERMKVQRLQEELKTVKSTNAKRIRELQKGVEYFTGRHERACCHGRFVEPVESEIGAGKQGGNPKVSGSYAYRFKNQKG